MLRRTDWTGETADAFGVLSDVVNHFLVQPFSPQNNNAIREAFPSFAWDIADVEPQNYTLWDSRIQVSVLCVVFCGYDLSMVADYGFSMLTLTVTLRGHV